VETKTKTVRIGGQSVETEAMLNNCGGAWTATARLDGRLIATGAGSTADDALASAIDRASRVAAEKAERPAG